MVIKRDRCDFVIVTYCFVVYTLVSTKNIIKVYSRFRAILSTWLAVHFFFLFDQFEASFIVPFFVMFLLAGAVDLWYAMVFRAYVSTSSVEALFLTNSSESSEFLKSYFS